MNIVTHDGTFHADEVFAIAFLRKFVLSKSIEIIRTRDEAILRNSINDRKCFVIDVGRKFDDKNKNFDHHQRFFKESWEDGIVLSSCGLIWQWMKKKGYLKKYSNYVLTNIEKKVIKKIDLHDNGQRTWPLASMVSLCNRENSTMDNFNNALSIVGFYIDNIFYQEMLNEKNDAIFENDLLNYDDGGVFYSSLSLKNGALLKRLSQNTKALVIVYQNHEDEDTKWYAKSLKRYYEDFDEPVSALAPEKWRGLSNKRLIDQSGMKGSVFVHRSGYMCICKNKKTSVLMAEKMIETYHETYDFI